MNMLHEMNTHHLADHLEPVSIVVRQQQVELPLEALQLNVHWRCPARHRPRPGRRPLQPLQAITVGDRPDSRRVGSGTQTAPDYKWGL